MRRMILLALALAAIATPGVSSAAAPHQGSAAAPAGPTLQGISICSDAFPFAVRGLVTGLEPNTNYGFRLETPVIGAVVGAFTTDATGSRVLGDLLADVPFEARTIIWLNPDGDVNEQEPGEPTVIDQTAVVDQPCTDARPKEPTRLDQCKNTGGATSPGSRTRAIASASSRPTGRTNPHARSGTANLAVIDSPRSGW